MQDEYALKNGINYRVDGYAFCDRCGCNQIVNDRCLKCDVTPTEADRKLADEIRSRCYRTSTGRIPECYDGHPQSFNKNGLLVFSRRWESREANLFRCGRSHKRA